MTAFEKEFLPFGNAGKLIGLLPAQRVMPDRFLRVIAATPIPTLLATIAASAADVRVQVLEVAEGQLVQWRYRVTTGAQLIVRRPQGARAYGTTSGQGFVSTDTETDWGTPGAGRHPTEFFFLGGIGEEIHFDELAAIAATDTRFWGWKLYVEPVKSWLMRNPVNLQEFISVDPLKVSAQQLHLLENFAGIVPLHLFRG